MVMMKYNNKVDIEDYFMFRLYWMAGSLLKIWKSSLLVDDSCTNTLLIRLEEFLQKVPHLRNNST